MTDELHREELIAALVCDYKEELADLTLDELRSHVHYQAQLKGMPADWWKASARVLSRMDC